MLKFKKKKSVAKRLIQLRRVWTSSVKTVRWGQGFTFLFLVSQYNLGAQLSASKDWRLLDNSSWDSTVITPLEGLCRIHDWVRPKSSFSEVYGLRFNVNLHQERSILQARTVPDSPSDTIQALFDREWVYVTYGHFGVSKLKGDKSCSWHTDTHRVCIHFLVVWSSLFCWFVGVITHTSPLQNRQRQPAIKRM